MDAERPLAYRADIAGGIGVVNLGTGEGWRALDGHASRASEDIDFTARGQVLTAPNRDPLQTALNPITISADNLWVYYGAINGTSIWRVPTAALADPDIATDALAAQVERYGDKPPSDGITIDAAGNVHVTDGGGNAIGVTRPDGSYEALIVDRRIDWPDGMSNGPDGFICVTVNRLNNAAPMNGGERTPITEPYYVMRFRALGDAAPGR